MTDALISGLLSALGAAAVTAVGAVLVASRNSNASQNIAFRQLESSDRKTSVAEWQELMRYWEMRATVLEKELRAKEAHCKAHGDLCGLPVQPTATPATTTTTTPLLQIENADGRTAATPALPPPQPPREI